MYLTPLCKHTAEIFFAISFTDHFHILFVCCSFSQGQSRTLHPNMDRAYSPISAQYEALFTITYFLISHHKNRYTFRKTNKTPHQKNSPHNSPIFHRLCFASSNCCLKTRKSMTSGISWYLITTEHTTIKR